MMKWFKHSFLKVNFLLLFIAVLTTLFLVTTGAYIQEGESISIGDVSKKRFKATRLVENRVATQRLKEEAEASVSPRFMKVPEVDDKIILKLDEFFSEVYELRKASNPIYGPYTSENEDLPLLAAEAFKSDTLDNPDILKEEALSPLHNEAPLDEVNEIFPTLEGQANSLRPQLYEITSELLEYMPEVQLQFLIDMETLDYNIFETDVYNIVFDVLEIGVREDTLSKNLVDIKGEFQKLYPNDFTAQIGYDIAALYIEPNMVIDEEATLKLKEERVSEVEPIYFLKDQNIVDEGAIITEELYYVLDDLGFVSKGYFENIMPILGSVIIVLSVFGFSLYYIILYHKELCQNKKETALLFTLYMVVILITKIFIKLPFVFVPVLAFTMLVGMLLEHRLALVLNLSITIITMLIYKGDIDYMIYYIIAGTIMAITSRYAAQRNNIYIISLIISIVSAVLISSLGILFERKFSTDIVMNMLYAFLDGFVTIVICMGSLPFWEAVFGVVTPIKLLDLVNPNNVLLRRLTIEAPGTYHHSLIVANLAETAAYDIGADPNIARVGGYYHDIGKLKYPQYFSENQLGENPHDAMDPYSSVEVITSHIKYGLEMANENKLPIVIKDIISQHHGNTLVKFFYFKAKEKAKEEENEDSLSESDFRYQNETPKSKEAAVVMLADTVEAAVRSMISKSKTMDEVAGIVRSLIKDKLDDGQLIDSGLTIKDIDTVANSFMRVFKGMYHERIPYPKEVKTEKKD